MWLFSSTHSGRTLRSLQTNGAGMDMDFLERAMKRYKLRRNMPGRSSAGQAWLPEQPMQRAGKAWEKPISPADRRPSRRTDLPQRTRAITVSRSWQDYDL